jgi:hypothetical protein
MEDKIKTTILAIRALVVMVGAPILAKQVYVDYNHNKDFTQYHTLRLGLGANSNQTTGIQLAKVRIKRFVLSGRSWEKKRDNVTAATSDD